MKKGIIVLLALAAVSAAVFAGTFTGRTGVALNYSYRDGINMGGLSVNNSGYSDTFPIGCTANVNADFDPTTGNCNAITMLVGPSYRYTIADSGMDIELALGVSATGENINADTHFLLGAGGYLGASYALPNGLGLAIGAQIGLDMLSVPLNGGTSFYQGTFYVTPSVGLVFNY